MTIALRSPEITRRGMLAGIGGMTFFFAFGTDGTRILPPADAATRPAPLSPWVRIAPDGNITILTVTEMGQGSGTSIPLMIAEEMDADWNKVTLEWAPSNPEIYGWPDRSGRRVMTVTGSRAVMMYWDDLRTAGAQVRKVLIANAAEHWGVDAATLKTEPSAVIDPNSGKRLSYGEIAAFGKVPAPLPAVDKRELKARKDFRLIGRSVPRRDLPFKVNGSAQYSIDVKLPGMVYASALHAPVSGNAPEKWNDAAIKAMPGVIATVKLPHGVGIVAESFPQAMAARRALRVTWSKNKVDGFDSEKALEHYAAIHADTAAPVKIVEAKGDIKPTFDGAAKVYKAEYRSDYSYHAQLEPLNAVARFNEAGDKTRGVGRIAGSRPQPRPGREDTRNEARAGRRSPVLSRRRLRAAFAGGLCRRGGGAGARGQAPGQAGVDARGRCRARHVPSDDLPVPRSSNRCVRQSRRLASLRHRR